MGTECVEQQAYEILLHLDESQSQGRRKGIVGFHDPGALAANDEGKTPIPESPSTNEDTTGKASTVRREMSEVERNAKSIADATLIQQAAAMAVDNALAKIPGFSQLNGIPHSPSVPLTQTGTEVKVRINGLVSAFIAKHSLIHGGGFVQQMAALSTVSKDTGHTEIQARLLGYCWQHICEHWRQKSKSGKLSVPCPRGNDCRMKHDSPEQWNQIEQDVCVLLLESYPNNQKKSLDSNKGFTSARI